MKNQNCVRPGLARRMLRIGILLMLLSAVPSFAKDADVPTSSAGHGVTATVATFAEQVIGTIGYPGILLAMTAESMVLPVPSEAVMPFAGFLVADSRLNMAWVIVVATVGSIFGFVISYWIGAWGGKLFVRRFGKYVLLDAQDLATTERFFERSGAVAIFVGRFIPMVRHLISLPAGVARMDEVKFVLFTAMGAGMWNSFLAIVGFYLRSNWTAIFRYGHTVDLIGAALLVAGFVAYLYVHLRRRSSLVRNGMDSD